MGETELPITPKKSPTKRRQKRVWHDAKMVIFTAVVASALSTLGTYLVNKSQFHDQTKHEIDLDKRRIYTEFVRAGDAYETAVKDMQFVRLEDKIEALFASTTILDKHVSESNGVVNVQLQTPTIIMNYRKLGNDEAGLQTQASHAYGEVSTLLRQARVRFGANVREKATAFIKTNSDFPNATINVEDYRQPLLLARATNSADEVQAVVIKINTDWEASLDKCSEWKLLADVADAMEQEIRAGN